MPGQALERLSFVDDADFLTRADRRRVVGIGALDDDRALIGGGIDRAQGFAGAAARVNVIVSVSVVEQAIRHDCFSQEGLLEYYRLRCNESAPEVAT